MAHLCVSIQVAKEIKYINPTEIKVHGSLRSAQCHWLLCVLHDSARGTAFTSKPQNTGPSVFLFFPYVKSQTCFLVFSKTVSETKAELEKKKKILMLFVLHSAPTVIADFVDNKGTQGHF